MQGQIVVQLDAFYYFVLHLPVMQSVLTLFTLIKFTTTQPQSFAGMFRGQVLNVPGKGAPAKRKDGQSGDLLIAVEVKKHPLFKRHGFDVHMDASIDFVEAALGTQLRYADWPAGGPMLLGSALY